MHRSVTCARGFAPRCMDALFVMIDERQLASLADLVVAMRPHGAPRWERGGVMAALRKVQHLSLGEVMMTAVAAAEDRDLRTPALIGDTDSGVWRRIAEQQAPTETPPVVAKVNPGRLCSVCSEPEVRCRERWADDHEYLPREDLRKVVDAQDPLVRSMHMADLRAAIRRFGAMPTEEPEEVTLVRTEGSEVLRQRQAQPHQYRPDSNGFCHWCTGPEGLEVHR